MSESANEGEFVGVADQFSATESADDLLAGVEVIFWLSRNLERTQAPLTPAQFRIMRRAAAGGERAARLAERLAVRKPTLTAIVDGLVNAGLVTRTADSTDRRATKVELTAEGRAALSETERAYAQRFGELLLDSDNPTDLLDHLVDLETNRLDRLITARPEGAR